MQNATDIVKYPFKLREEARRVDIVPTLQSDLMSIGKMADAGYLTIFDDEEVNIYDLHNTTVTVSKGSVLRGWRCKETGLWRIPLVENVTNLNTETVICKAPPTESLPNRPPITEAVHNVYELQTVPERIRYFHVCAGFPTKRTWMKAIKGGFFASWPGLTEKAVNQHFPESEETQRGHMRKRPSGLRSTK